MAFLPLLQPISGYQDPSWEESNFIQTIEVRSTVRIPTMAAEVRQVLAENDPHFAVLRVSTVSDHIDLLLNQENVVAALATFFGLLALALSCLGLYGLMAYTVQRRTGEMGIRMALGASRVAVIRMVIRQALAQGLAGVLIGIPASIASTRLVANQLYGVSPNDPKYAVGAALILLLCIAFAAGLPARRAARIDPMIALRYE